MISHLRFGIVDYAASTAFYDRALLPLGYKRLYEMDAGGKRAGYGARLPALWLAEQEAPSATIHIAIAAESREAVDGFHREALAAGGRDNGAPGYRPYFPGYYAAYVIDPDGNNIEALFHDQSVA